MSSIKNQSVIISTLLTNAQVISLGTHQQNLIKTDKYCAN